MASAFATVLSYEKQYNERSELYHTRMRTNISYRHHMWSTGYKKIKFHVAHDKMLCYNLILSETFSDIHSFI